MSDMVDEKTYAASIPWPNMRAEAEDGMRQIFRMGLMHAAFELRGTDFLDIPDEHLNRIATYIEELALQENLGPVEWKLPDAWG